MTIDKVAYSGMNRRDFVAVAAASVAATLLPRSLAATSLLQAQLVKNATLKGYKGFPHGMATTHADVINADLLAFIKS
jgi:hypothetical protein